jgi:hypothetical protein
LLARKHPQGDQGFEVIRFHFEAGLIYIRRFTGVSRLAKNMAQQEIIIRRVRPQADRLTHKRNDLSKTMAANLHREKGLPVCWKRPGPAMALGTPLCPAAKHPQRRTKRSTLSK